jgi:hypothetical protein
MPAGRVGAARRIAGPIGALIVDREDFEPFTIILLDQGGDCVGDSVALVPRGNDCGDGWPLAPRGGRDGTAIGRV